METEKLELLRKGSRKGKEECEINNIWYAQRKSAKNPSLRKIREPKAQRKTEGVNEASLMLIMKESRTEDKKA